MGFNQDKSVLHDPQLNFFQSFGGWDLIKDSAYKLNNQNQKHFLIKYSYIVHPFDKLDIFYPGSVCAISQSEWCNSPNTLPNKPSYQCTPICSGLNISQLQKGIDQENNGLVFDSVIELPNQQIQTPCWIKFIYIKNMLIKLFDLELFRNAYFIYNLMIGITFQLVFFIPYVYLIDYAIGCGLARQKSLLFLIIMSK